MLNTFIVAATFGLAIAVAIYTIAHTSGGHVNPAVTIGMVASGVTTPVQAIGHIAGQVTGSLIAVVLLVVLVPHSVLKGTHLGANVVPEGSHFFHAFLGAPLVLYGGFCRV
jgi:glycerol uptake facilitator-like aquaporin